MGGRNITAVVGFIRAPRRVGGGGVARDTDVKDGRESGRIVGYSVGRVSRLECPTMQPTSPPCCRPAGRLSVGRTPGVDSHDKTASDTRRARANKRLLNTRSFATQTPPSDTAPYRRRALAPGRPVGPPLIYCILTRQPPLYALFTAI